MRLTHRIIKRLKSFRISFIIYNFFNRRKLAHNKQFYKTFNIRKPVYWNVSSVDFENLPDTRPWLDKPEALQELTADPEFLAMDTEFQQMLINWVDNGFMIWKNFVPVTTVSAINDEVERLLSDADVHPLPNGKIMFAHLHSAVLNNVISDERLLRLLNFVFRQPVIPFQTINFRNGSQQKAHSDSIHMTTYPLGYLAAGWLALEPVTDANGPLFYYPGSHRMPYFLSPQLDAQMQELSLNEDRYSGYETAIGKLLEGTDYQKAHFYANPGDLLIWHANLLHGGEPILDTATSRKSMVAHYFARDVIKYHEISRRPAIIGSKP